MPRSRRASSRASSGSASCRTGTSWCRTTAIRSGTATSRSPGSRRRRSQSPVSRGPGWLFQGSLPMRRLLAPVCLAFFFAIAAVSSETPRIQVVADPVAPRVDVTIDGKPFTSYIYERSQKRPSLYPLRTAKGTIVTRGYPLDPHPGERADHPHHVGLWFNYGDVNGLDFWNNSDAIPADRAAKMGTILHRRVIEAKGGAARGDLEVETEWV